MTDLHVIMGTLDEPDGHDWIVGVVERAEDIERVITKLYAEQKVNRAILGPYRREERIFWKRYQDAEKQYVDVLAIHKYDFDLLHKLGKAHQRAWSERHTALFAKAKEVASVSLDRKPMYRLERPRYYAAATQTINAGNGDAVVEVRIA